jgi:imidazoleglycerol-phosphate dehydratase
MTRRSSHIERSTKETQVKLDLDLDGAGRIDAQTGVGFLDHMLAHVARHSDCDITVQAKGDTQVDDHHTTEDVGICLGQAIAEALGDKAGINRYGWASVPMEETLANVALDVSGRAEVVFNVRFSAGKIGSFDVQLVEEFLRAMCRQAGINMHVNVPYGSNDHHIAEAIFKAFAQAFRAAKQIDPRRQGQVPSTKGTL